jgi:hypothetical protein
MDRKRPRPPQPDRIRSLRRSCRWIDHRFFRRGFDQALTRTEKLLYLVLAAVSNREGVSLYSDARMADFLDTNHLRELTSARDELVTRNLIVFKDGIYQVLELPPHP